MFVRIRSSNSDRSLTRRNWGQVRSEMMHSLDRNSPDLTPVADEEAQLLREQLLARAPGTALAFPKRHGSPWRYSAFQRLVWRPMLRDAAKAWMCEQKTPEPFSGLTCHDLRHTAASLMCQAGMPAELVAERLGHVDGGALLLRTYRHVRAGETRAALDAIGSGFRTLLVNDGRDAESTNVRVG